MNSHAASRRHVHTIRVPLRWGDMDAYRHVNNTVYFRYMEEVRVDYLERLGHSVGTGATAPVIITTSCTFLVPITYPGVVEVAMFLAPPGRSSIVTEYEMRLAGDSALCATGSAKIVWIDVASGGSVPIPDTLRALFAPA